MISGSLRLIRAQLETITSQVHIKYQIALKHSTLIHSLCFWHHIQHISPLTFNKYFYLDREPQSWIEILIKPDLALVSLKGWRCHSFLDQFRFYSSTFLIPHVHNYIHLNTNKQDTADHFCSNHCCHISKFLCCYISSQMPEEMSSEPWIS